MNLEQALTIFEIKEIHSLEELKKIYHHLAKQNHPDLALTNEEQVQRELKMQEINSAYDILKNATEEDFINLKKGNCKTQLHQILTELEEFSLGHAYQIEEILANNTIPKEEVTKFLYKFLKNRKDYYYKKTSPFLFQYHYDNKVFKKEDWTYLKVLCENVDMQHIVDILLEINTIIRQVITQKVSMQKECLVEYASLNMYPYTEQQKNELIKILRKKMDINMKRKMFLKASLYFQLEESILNYVSTVLSSFKEEERTYARKQLFLTKTFDIVENIVDLKIYNKEINFSHSKKRLEIPLFFSLSKSLRRNTNLFLLKMRKVFENNNFSLTEEELKEYGKKLYFIILESSHEKVIEPPQYVLRNKRISF